MTSRDRRPRFAPWIAPVSRRFGIHPASSHFLAALGHGIGVRSRPRARRIDLPGKSQAPLRLVGRRRVVHISGFEPIGVDGLDRRMKSGLRKFAPCGAPRRRPRSRRSPRTGARSPGTSIRPARTGRPDCRYTVLRWDELMQPYTGRSWLGRVAERLPGAVRVRASRERSAAISRPMSAMACSSSTRFWFSSGS